jgi:hypothetical protein
MHRHRSEYQVSCLPSLFLRTSKQQGESLGRCQAQPGHWKVATMKDSAYFIGDAIVVGEDSVCTYTLVRHTVGRRD